MSNTCFTCNTNIIPSTNSLLTSCMSCLTLFCINCEDLTIKIAKFYNSNNNPGCIWNCTKCRKQHSAKSISVKLDQIENTLVEIINNSKPRSSTPIESFSSILKSELKQHTTNIMISDRDKEYRKYNHILHGVDDSIEATTFVEILFSCHLKSSIKPITVKRIAQKNQSVKKLSLICIRYNSESDKISISQKLKKVMYAPDKYITISNDLTLNEQSELKEKSIEANKLNEENPSNDEIHRVLYDTQSTNFIIVKIKRPPISPKSYKELPKYQIMEKI